MLVRSEAGRQPEENFPFARPRGTKALREASAAAPAGLNPRWSMRRALVLALFASSAAAAPLTLSVPSFDNNPGKACGV